MNKVSLFLIFVLINSICSAQFRYDNYKLLSVSVSSENQTSALLDEFPENDRTYYLKVPHLNKTGMLLVSNRVFKKLLQSKIVDIKVLNENFQRTLDQEKSQMQRAERAFAHSGKDSIFRSFPRHPSINDYIEDLAAENPQLSSIQTIGRSFENREIKIIRIGKNHKDDSKPAIWIDAGIHAREWAAPTSALYIAKSLIQDYAQDSMTKKLVDSFNWYILPSANPDGYEYSHTVRRLWRKTRSNRNGWCIGVDPNRNFGFHWNEGGASNNPCSEIYAGPHPFSEKETQAIRDFVLPRKNNIKASLSIHSFSQLWLSPWGYTSKVPDHYDDLMAKASIGVKAIYEKHGRRFKQGSSTNVLYAAAGGTDDWMLGGAGIRYAYTLELRPSDQNSNGFVLPVNEITPAAEEAWAGIKHFAYSIL